MPCQRPFRLALLLLAFTACDDGDQDTTCSLSVAVSGDVSAQLPGDDGVACLIQHSLGEGIDVDYVALGLPVERVDLDIGGIMKGMTGDAFPAALGVTDHDGKRWATDDCTVSVSEHEFHEPAEFGDAYRVRGEGLCASPLVDATGVGSVTLAPFEFVVVVTWAK